MQFGTMDSTSSICVRASVEVSADCPLRFSFVTRIASLVPSAEVFVRKTRDLKSHRERDRRFFAIEFSISPRTFRARERKKERAQGVLRKECDGDDWKHGGQNEKFLLAESCGFVFAGNDSRLLSKRVRAGSRHEIRRGGGRMRESRRYSRRREDARQRSARRALQRSPIQGRQLRGRAPGRSADRRGVSLRAALGDGFQVIVSL